MTGAASGVLESLFGGALDLDVFSPVTGTTRHFGTADALDAETMNARIWLGNHFRRAMTDANQLGHAVAAHATSRFLRPTG